MSVHIALPSGVLIAIVAACFIGPIVFSLPLPTNGSILDAGLPPLTPGHLFGTDQDGNDVLSRLLYGGRSSLLIAAFANAVGLLIGSVLGSLSGYRGGVVDSILMRTLDGFIAIPSLVLVLAVAHSIESSLFGTVFALTSFTIPAFARVARAEALRIREQPFILAARLANTSTSRILACHLLPNLVPQLLTFFLLGFGITIMIEGGLSYLGLGVLPPAPSWGNMIQHSQQVISMSPSHVILPSSLLFLTVLSCNWLGDALRDRRDY